MTKLPSEVQCRHLAHVVVVVAAVATCLMVAAPASAETIDRIAAIVDDDVITFHDVRQDGKIRLATTGIDIRMLDMAPNRSEQIEQLVERIVQTRLLVQEANRMKAPIDESKVNARLQLIYDRFNKTEAEYRAALEEEGIDWGDFRAFLRKELKSQFVIRTELGGQVSVSDAEIEACALEEVPGGEQQVAVAMRQILVAASPRDEDIGESKISEALYPVWWDAVDRARYSAAAMLYVRAVKGDEPFETLATNFSSGSSRERGGYLGVYSPGDLAEAFDPVFDLEPGQISDIIETEAGFHIITVEETETVENDEWEKALKQCRGELLNKATQKLIAGYTDTLAERHFVDIKLFEDLAQEIPFEEE